MYLSHNIVNQLIKIEAGLVELTAKDFNQKLQLKAVELKNIKSLFYFINSVGIEITLKDAERLNVNKKIETQDLRGELIDNYRNTVTLVTNLAAQKSLILDTAKLLEINATLAAKTVEDWKFKYREEGETFAMVYDDLLELAKNPNATPEIETLTVKILNDYYGYNSLNRFYKLSLLVQSLLQIQPFIAYNKYTIALITDLLLSQEINIQDNIFNIMEFFITKQSDIKRAFNNEVQANIEVAWHELFLGFFANTIEELLVELEKSNDNKSKLNKPFLDLNRRQLRILKYLQTIHSLKREDYVQMMDVSTMTAYRDLQGLVDYKLIKTMGIGRGTKYVLSSR